MLPLKVLAVWSIMNNLNGNEKTKSIDILHRDFDTLH